QCAIVPAGGTSAANFPGNENFGTFSLWRQLSGNRSICIQRIEDAYAGGPPWSSGRSELRSSPCHRIQGAGRPPPSLCERRDRNIVDATVPSPPPGLRRRRGIPVNKKSKKRAPEPMTARGDSLGCSRNPR